MYWHSSSDCVPCCQEYSSWERNQTARGEWASYGTVDKRWLEQLIRSGKCKTLTLFQNEMIERGALLYPGKPFSMS